MQNSKILKELEQFIAIESVSTDPERAKQVEEAADFLTYKLKSLGFNVKSYKKGIAPPLLIAERKVAGAKKTIGIYGHYDVQPEDPKEEWQTEPFKLTLKNDKMWARGIADDKGHVWQNITALEELITHNPSLITHNFVFVLEGEEEVGSTNLEHLLVQAKNILAQVDVFYITDVGMQAKNVPQIYYGLRGLVYFELEVTVGTRDLHSGIYGNRVYNPIQLIAELFGKIKDSQTGKILIPHFYDKVRAVSKKEIEVMEKSLRGSEDLKKEAGVYGFAPSPVHQYLSSKIHPSFDPNGIIGGYTGPGSKTVIPRTASAKFSLRLVENQNPDEIEQLVKNFIAKQIPQDVKYVLRTNSKDAPFYASYENEYVRKTAQALQAVFGHEVVYNRSGGSIPVAENLQRLFKKPIILTGFTLPDENLHSPNENFDEEMFWKGIEALQKIYQM